MTDFLFICVYLNQYFNGVIRRKEILKHIPRALVQWPCTHNAAFVWNICYHILLFLSFFFSSIQILTWNCCWFFFRNLCIVFYSILIFWAGGEFRKIEDFIKKKILLCNSIYHLICIRYIIFLINSHYFFYDNFMSVDLIFFLVLQPATVIFNNFF